MNKQKDKVKIITSIGKLSKEGTPIPNFYLPNWQQYIPSEVVVDVISPVGRSGNVAWLSMSKGKRFIPLDVNELATIAKQHPDIDDARVKYTPPQNKASKIYSGAVIFYKEGTPKAALMTVNANEVPEQIQKEAKINSVHNPIPEKVPAVMVPGYDGSLEKPTANAVKTLNAMKVDTVSSGFHTGWTKRDGIKERPSWAIVMPGEKIPDRVKAAAEASGLKIKENYSKHFALSAIYLPDVAQMDLVKAENVFKKFIDNLKKPNLRYPHTSTKQPKYQEPKFKRPKTTNKKPKAKGASRMGPYYRRGGGLSRS